MLLGAAGRIRGDWLSISASELAAAAGEGFSVLAVSVSDPARVRDADIGRVKRSFEQAGLEIGQTNGRYGRALVSPRAIPTRWANCR